MDRIKELYIDNRGGIWFDVHRVNKDVTQGEVFRNISRGNWMSDIKNSTHSKDFITRNAGELQPFIPPKSALESLLKKYTGFDVNEHVMVTADALRLAATKTHTMHANGEVATVAATVGKKFNDDCYYVHVTFIVSTNDIQKTLK